MSDAVIIAIIGAIVAIVNVCVTALVVVKVRDVHQLVNGMNHELRAAEKGQNQAEGFTAGEAAQRERETP